MQGIPSTFNGKPRRFVWTYRDEANQVQGYVARFDGDGKKEVVPFFKRINGHAWESGALAEPRPLYGLEMLAQTDPSTAVFIVEGEKAAATLRSIGIPAVTSLGASQDSAGFVREWQIIGDLPLNPPIPAVIPISRPSCHAGPKSGRYTKPRTSACHVEGICALIKELGANRGTT